jgi:hypothetical protein
MPYYEFAEEDVFRNRIKTYPKVEFFIHKRRVYYNNTSGSNPNVSPGMINLHELNVGRDPDVVPSEVAKLRVKSPLIYSYVTKGGSQQVFKTISTGSEYYTTKEYGDELKLTYPLTSSISARYYFSTADDVWGKRKIYALKNTLNHYKNLSEHYAVSSSMLARNLTSSLWDGGTEDPTYGYTDVGIKTFQFTSAGTVGAHCTIEDALGRKLTLVGKTDTLGALGTYNGELVPAAAASAKLSYHPNDTTFNSISGYGHGAAGADIFKFEVGDSFILRKPGLGNKSKIKVQLDSAAANGPLPVGGHVIIYNPDGMDLILADLDHAHDTQNSYHAADRLGGTLQAAINDHNDFTCTIDLNYPPTSLEPDSALAQKGFQLTITQATVGCEGNTHAGLGITFGGFVTSGWPSFSSTDFEGGTYCISDNPTQVYYEVGDSYTYEGQARLMAGFNFAAAVSKFNQQAGGSTQHKIQITVGSDSTQDLKDGKVTMRQNIGGTVGNTTITAPNTNFDTSLLAALIAEEFAGGANNQASQGQTGVNLIQIPSIFYGSSIRKGSVELNWYHTGTLIGRLRDIKHNGELVHVSKGIGETNNKLSGSTQGVILYNEGIIILTGSTNIISGPDADIKDYYLGKGSTVYPRWDYWGGPIAHNQSYTYGDLLPSSSFGLSFEGINYISTLTMMAHAPRYKLNWSNNPTAIKYGQNKLLTKTGVNAATSSLYKENEFLEIKNVISSSHAPSTGSFKKQTYISKIGIYDKERKLIGVAKLATPVKKNEDLDYTFKLKLDI